MKYFIVVDGASSGNGLSAGIGVVVKNEDGTTIHKISEGIGKKSNNEAEYEAVIAGLKYALDNKYTDVVILTDSNLIFNQIKGEYRTKKNHLKPLLEKVKILIDSFNSFDIDFVPREYTHEADELARIGSETGLEKQVEKKYPFLTKQI